MESHPPRRRLAASRPPHQPPDQPSRMPVLLLALSVLCLAYLLRQPAPPSVLARPGMTAQSIPPELAERLLALLPAGAEITGSALLLDGSIALAWVSDGAARTGVALAEPGSGHRLWVAETPGRADVARTASVEVIQLDGLAEQVLVSSYRTENCCAWVNLFALSDPPRVLFASPTATSRLLEMHVVVQKRLPGEYPGAPAADTDVYTWNGRAFSLSGVTLAPQHFFPLAARTRWTYAAGKGRVVERWVQGTKQAGDEVQYLIRSVAREGSAISALPETVYVYGPDGSVLQRSPEAMQLVGPSPGEGSAWKAAEGETAAVVEVKPWVTVPAGTFRDVLVVGRGSTRLYLAPFVGLIREDRGEQPVLELIHYGDM